VLPSIKQHIEGSFTCFSQVGEHLKLKYLTVSAKKNTQPNFAGRPTNRKKVRAGRKNHVCFLEKPRVVLGKTTCAFLENHVWFFQKPHVVFFSPSLLPKNLPVAPEICHIGRKTSA
jgi:hypothetical protein